MSFFSGFEIVNQSADIVVSQPSLTLGRFQKADFTYGAFYRSFVFYNRLPRPMASMGTLTYPFDDLIWLFTISSVVFVGAALFATNLGERNETRRKMTVFNVVIASLSPVLSDGVPNRQVP